MEKIEKQYEKLVHKIVNQLKYKTSVLDYEDLVQYGWEGLINAFQSYKEGTSQSFGQYAGWQIRFAILNSINKEGSTVRYNNYNKFKDSRAAIPYVSLSTSLSDDKPIIDIKDDTVDNRFETDESLELLKQYLEKKFSKRDTQIFYESFGLSAENNNIQKGKELAKKFKLSSASISIINKKIINHIKQNKKLQECLADAMNYEL